MDRVLEQHSLRGLFKCFLNLLCFPVKTPSRLFHGECAGSPIAFPHALTAPLRSQTPRVAMRRGGAFDHGLERFGCGYEFDAGESVGVREVRF